MRRDIDEALQGWPSDAEPGDVVAREIVARDGRKVLQLRVELGILQMEVDTRPDGTRPHGCASYLDYLEILKQTRDVVEFDRPTPPDYAAAAQQAVNAFQAGARWSIHPR